jgi:hypothetical protein
MFLFMHKNYGCSHGDAAVAPKVPMDDLWAPRLRVSPLSVSQQSVIGCRLVIYSPGMRMLSSPRVAQAGKCLEVRIYSAGDYGTPRIARGGLSLVRDSFSESAFDGT